MIVVLMGVAGSGKTTVGTALAALRGWRFIDGDALHPPPNIEKMRAGIPLDDADRDPWIDELGAAIRAMEAQGADAVVACSALRAAHRARLCAAGDVRVVFLKVDYATASRRIRDRTGHFMHLGLLQSQFDALQEPDEALVVRDGQTPAAIAWRISEWLTAVNGPRITPDRHSGTATGQSPGEPA